MSGYEDGEGSEVLVDVLSGGVGIGFLYLVFFIRLVFFVLEEIMVLEDIVRGVIYVFKVYDDFFLVEGLVICYDGDDKD